MNTTSNEKSYFNLHTSGIGYLQRAREVPIRGSRRAQPFLACTIAALVEHVDEPEYRYFNTIVATPEAEHLVRRCIQAIEGDRKVLIAFRLNDVKVDPYIYPFSIMLKPPSFMVTKSAPVHRSSQNTLRFCLFDIPPLRLQRV